MVLPAAFVALDSEDMLSATAETRLRVIAAGAFHNLLTFLVLVLCSRSAFGNNLLSILGYADISQIGVAVVSLEAASASHNLLVMSADHR